MVKSSRSMWAVVLAQCSASMAIWKSSRWVGLSLLIGWSMCFHGRQRVCLLGGTSGNYGIQGGM